MIFKHRKDLVVTVSVKKYNFSDFRVKLRLFITTLKINIEI